MEQGRTLHNLSTGQGHRYLHQLLFLPQTALEHHRQNPYHTHPEHLGAQSFPQLAPPALPPRQISETLQQGPPPDTATTVQQRGSSNADRAEPDPRNCGAVAWTAACRHLARDTAGLRQYRPTDRTALVSTVAAVTMEPVAPWPAQLLPHVPCRDTRPHQAATTYTPTAPLTVCRHGGATGRHQGEFCPPARPGADRREHTKAAARRAPPVARHTPRAHPRQGRWWRRSPSRASAGRSAGGAGGGLPRHPARPRRRVPVPHPRRGPLDRLARHRQAGGIPAPCGLASGAHPGLLYDGGPMAARSPATHRQRPKQEAGTGAGQSPRTGVEPRPVGASTGRMAGRRHQGQGRPRPPRRANHARPPGGYPGGGSTETAEPAVGSLYVQPGGRAHRHLRP